MKQKKKKEYINIPVKMTNLNLSWSHIIFLSLAYSYGNVGLFLNKENLAQRLKCKNVRSVDQVIAKLKKLKLIEIHKSNGRVVYKLNPIFMSKLVEYLMNNDIIIQDYDFLFDNNSSNGTSSVSSGNVCLTSNNVASLSDTTAKDVEYTLQKDDTLSQNNNNVENNDLIEAFDRFFNSDIKDINNSDMDNNVKGILINKRYVTLGKEISENSQPSAESSATTFTETVYKKLFSKQAMDEDKKDNGTDVISVSDSKVLAQQNEKRRELQNKKKSN